MRASTTVLHPSTCTARREAGQHHLQLLFCCEAGHLVAVGSRGLCRAESPPAVCLQRPGSAGCVCLPCHLCHAMPTAPLNVLAPVHFALPPHLFIPCAPGSSSSCNSLQAARTVPLAATTRVCSGGPRAVVRYAIKSGSLGLHVGSRPSSPHLHCASQRLHASSLAPC